MNAYAPVVLPFEAVVDDVSAGNSKVQKGGYLPVGAYPVVDQGQEFVGGFSNDAGNLVAGDGPWIVFGDHTRVLKYVDFPFCMGADGVKVLKPRPENAIDTKYLFHFLNANAVPSAGYSRHYKFLKRLDIPIPTLDEQRRIATILDKADALRRKRKRALELLDGLTQSIFLEMFGDPRRDHSRWERMPLSDLGRVSTGKTPPTSDAENFANEMPFLTPGDLESGAPPTRFVSRKGAAYSKMVEPGAALVCCIGATIGKMDIAITTSAFNQQINAVQWGQKILPEFGLQAIHFCKEEIISRALSTTLPILKKSEFEKIEVIVPPVKFQSEFDHRVSVVRRLKSKFLRHMQISSLLFSSLQHRAFSGQL